MSVTRAVVIAEAREWLGTPWQHQAALKGVACDCIGYLAGVDINIGLPEGAAWLADPLYRGYGPMPIPELLLEACAKYMDPIPIDQATLADVLLLSFADRGVTQPMHFAFISNLEPRRIIHALAVSPRRVVEHDVDAIWASRIVGAYALRGVS